jgi:uncharacterized protein YuzE
VKPQNSTIVYVDEGIPFLANLRPARIPLIGRLFKTNAPSFQYDQAGDAVYIVLTDEDYGHGQSLDDNRVVDYSPSGEPVGVKLLNVSRGVDVDGLPEADTIGKLLEAHHITTV